MHYTDPGTESEIIRQLQSLTPGKTVVYGYYWNATATLVSSDNPDRRKITELVKVLDRANCVMLFHKRLPNNRVVCVARGVEPAVRLRLEEILARIPLPK